MERLGKGLQYYAQYTVSDLRLSQYTDILRVGWERGGSITQYTGSDLHLNQYTDKLQRVGWERANSINRVH